MMKYFIAYIIFGMFETLQGICNQHDNQHCDKQIVNCPYTQEDIYRGFSKNTRCYQCEERRKQCFYCGCPIAEHTKQEKESDKKYKKRK